MKLQLPPRKWVIIGLAFLCVESFLIDTIMDMQAKEEAQASRWNAALINEIHKLSTERE